MQKQLTIGLLWHSLVSGNLGVGALTESNIAIILALAEKNNTKVNFIVLGSRANGLDELTQELKKKGHSIECYAARVFKKSYINLVKRCDFIIDIGEGDSFADIYGFKRFFYLWLSKNIACALGVKIILAPQTIGPFNHWYSKLFAKQIMRKCHTIFARDYLSKSYLEKLGITENIKESIDVAFRLPFNKANLNLNSKIKIGLNVSGLLYNGGYTGNNQLGLSLDYPDTINKLIKALMQLPDTEIHLVSHVIEPNMPVEDDFAVANKLASKYPGIIVAPHFKRPSEAKSYIAALDFFSGGRMHACVAAFSSGVPVVPMAYSRKFNGLFGSLGYHHIADCKVDSQALVIEKILEGFKNKETLQEEIKAGLALVNNKLAHYENAIEAMMKFGIA